MKEAIRALASMENGRAISAGHLEEDISALQWDIVETAAQLLEAFVGRLF